MSMLRDQGDLLCAFNAEGVEYLVVGGQAVNAHGAPRLTKDLDLFLRNTADNSERVFKALARFGAPIAGLSPADFRDHPDDVFQIGVEPSRIDLLQHIAGVDFDSAWERRQLFAVEDGLTVPFLALDDLLANKLASGRPQDLADVDKLSKIRNLK
jgi:hypothetical protein